MTRPIRRGGISGNKTRGHSRPRVKIALPSRLSLDRQFHIHRALFLCQRTAQFGKRDILQLPNALPRDTKFFTYFLKRLRLSTVQTKALKDDLLLPVIQDVQQPADLVSQIFIPQQLKWRLRLLVADDFAELGRIVVADRRVE